MSIVDDCLQRAEECKRWAAQAKSEKEREIFLYIARAWTNIALRHAAKLLTQPGDENNKATPQPRS
jgi:hypothetical protein